ncbi:hypothetical protein SPI_06518 [Niveomyces insectorum RCEF 264]|uniref:Uncharacterized protein n=1 Tax=Niveomyces insectorum RCEF 264 TaxID=1081102 RepID=A0A167RBM6_9HYPO|nr:hypothetical protein SPI_06518 [Niveomyces insectorum RCEF 264]
MDLPPAKRRRTSPRLAGNANSTDKAGNGEADTDNAANNSKDNENDKTNSTTTPPDPLPGTAIPPPKRPSFASPTRASLARHNPEILGRRRSVPRNPGDNEDSETVEALLDAQLGQSSAEKVDAVVRPLSQPPVRSPTRVRLSSPQRTSLFSEPPVRSSPARSPGRSSPARFSARSPARRLGSLLTEPPRRSPIKPIPRPLPPPDPQRSEDILEPLLARERRRSGLDRFRVYQEQPPEPELPPTPEHPDPELTTSPPGIHTNSTPSKRPWRGKTHGKMVSSSSPLKQPPLKAPRVARAAAAAVAGKAKEKVPEPEDGTPSTSILLDAGGNASSRGRGRPSRTSAARGIRPPDPNADKKKERDVLLAEIGGLEADLALVAAENERIREAVAARGSLFIAPPPAPPLPANKRADLFRLLRRRALPPEEAVPDPTAAWLQAAANPIAFLPFGKPTSDFAALSALLRGNGLAAGESDSQQEAPPPISHLPLPMTADEELPYLQAFTPLAFSSRIVILPQAAPDAPLLQKHFVTVTSTSPPGVFLAHMEVTVHSQSLRITDLRVPRLDPAAAATGELQPLIDRVTVRSQKAAGSSALVRNATVLAWAMGEWVRVAVRRARFWVALERLLRAKGAPLASSVRRLRARQRKAHRRQRTRRGGGAPANYEADSDEAEEEEEEGGDNDANDDGDDELNGVGVKPKRKAAANGPRVSTAELLAHMGRTAMDVDVPRQGADDDDNGSNGRRNTTSVRVQWTIQFDWTGEAQSQMGILVGVPGKWRKADDRGRLAGLPKLFEQLIHNRDDPTVAVQTVVALLAGEVDA